MDRLLNENILVNKSVKFAIRIVKAYEYLCEDKKMYIMGRQLLRSGTSIGANVTESTGAISTADFSAKISIAYKESLETKYWLYVLRSCAYIDERMYESIYKDTDELSKMLFATLKKTRIKAKSKVEA